MKKALTPKRVAYRASLLLTAVVTILGIVPVSVVLGTPVAYFLIPTPFLLLGAAYGIFYLLMEKYINQRIKLIYRTIHAEKIGRPLETLKVDMNTDAFREINRDVEHWAKDSRLEIESLKEKAKFRREFIGNLSHELKTPLTIIQGNILTLLEGAVEDKLMRDRFLIKAAENVERLDLLIQDLDRITKLESGRDEIETEKFDLAIIVKEVVDNLQGKAKKNEVEIEVVLHSNLDMSVIADRHKIDQVLTNLIINSIKYNKTGGKTRITFEDLGDNILVEIRDSGIGIDEKHLPRLFERFYRVDSSRARHIGGTGLGLAIVKHIIDAHHQTINVRSVIDEGSTFSFTLKRA
ncbi:MAG: two-component sensor histidine kinase [Crocinitomicaceae bacterium]|nr:two-component sensor histidine kinase [Crocinitomicaceae bacterium]